MQIKIRGQMPWNVEFGNREVAMLVLTRRVGESIRIGNDIVVTLVQMGPGKVRIGIEAPDSTTILREELVQSSPPLPLPLPNLPGSFSDREIGRS